jgi:hypothetical protein
MAKRDDQVTIEPLPLSVIDDKSGEDNLLMRLRLEHRARRRAGHGVVALTDRQLTAITTAAARLEEPEKRSLLLQRVASHLRLFGRHCGGCYSDADIELALRSSLLGLNFSGKSGTPR